METNKNKTIVLTGGGTAGHVTVNISLQEALKKHFSKIVYIGSKNGIESELVKKRTNYNFHAIDVVKFNRKNLLKNLLIPFKLKRCVREAMNLLKEEKPCVIFSKGGYVGLPVVIAGKKLGIPVVCHESDLSMGLANKVAKKYANVICTNFKLTAEKNGSKCVWTGMPIIKSNLSKSDAKSKLCLPNDKLILLVTGGSLGAQAINEFVFTNIDAISKNFFVVHIVGKGNTNSDVKNKNYKQIEFTDDMKTIMRASDFALSRAGANTAIELLSNEVLTTFVPLPKGSSRGDQVENANHLKSLNICETISQENLNIDSFNLAINNLKKNAKLIQKNLNSSEFSSGTEKIVKILLDESQKNSNKKEVE